MASALEWVPKKEEQFWHVAVAKEERNSLFRTKRKESFLENKHFNQNQPMLFGLVLRYNNQICWNQKTVWKKLETLISWWNKAVGQTVCWLI